MTADYIPDIHQACVLEQAFPWIGRIPVTHEQTYEANAAKNAIAVLIHQLKARDAIDGPFRSKR